MNISKQSTIHTALEYCGLKQSGIFDIIASFLGQQIRALRLAAIMSIHQ